MKKILLIALLFASCSKEPETTTPAKSDCKTCDTKLTTVLSGQPAITVTESSIEYCDGKWTAYDGKTTTWDGNDGAGIWRKTRKTTCH